MAGFFFLYPTHTNGQFDLTFKQSIYINTNLPNLENQNGYYFPKGNGTFSSLLVKYSSKHYSLSAEPIIQSNRALTINVPSKTKLFSVLNDVPKHSIYKPNQFRNTGLTVHYNGITAGFGNWDQWWGPGMHNSLVLSNNAEGFYHYFIGTNAYQTIVSNLSFKFKYMVSDEMKNWAGADYFYSAWFLNLRYKEIEFGMSRNVLSGGYSDLPWSLSDAMTVLVNHKNSMYWDAINEYYLLASFPE